MAENVHQKYSKDLTDFEWYFDVIKGCLKTSDDKTMQVLSQRMPAEAMDEHYYKRVMEMGDATDVLEEADVKVAEAEQKTQEDKHQKHKLFEREFKDKMDTMPKPVVKKG